MNTYAPEERSAAITPTLVAGLAWLYEAEQPRDALVQPQGIALPAVVDRRFIFVPDVGGQGAAVVVHVITQTSTDEPASPAREVITEAELADLAEGVMAAHGGVHARVVSSPGTVSGHLQLSAKAHPSLLAAVTRYRAGCPRHRLPACGYIRNTQCTWFSRGFARLTLPTAPPPAPSRRTACTGVVAPHPPRRSPNNIAALGAANQHRRDSGAARAVAIAGEAIATLSRRTRRSAITEEALRVLQLRVEHPEYSLRELAAAHTPPLTKDSYAARLRRALRAADGQCVQVRQHRHTNAA